MNLSKTLSQPRLEIISKSHKRDKFDCGVKSLNNFLKRYARQNSTNGLNKTYVFTDNEKNVYGYFSIAASSIEPEYLPSGFPLAKIPSILIARLAVDKSMQGNGLGAYLLTEAIIKVVELSEMVGIYCITVDAIDSKAISFYEHFGFTRVDDSKLLFMHVTKAKASKI